MILLSDGRSENQPMAMLIPMPTTAQPVRRGQYHRFEYANYNRHESARDNPKWRP